MVKIRTKKTRPIVFVLFYLYCPFPKFSDTEITRTLVSVTPSRALHKQEQQGDNKVEIWFVNKTLGD